MVDYSCKHYQIKCAKSEDACKEYTEQAKDYADSINPDRFLNKEMITNCITEIPQDIKLELVDGVLTLKAGSKVYIPNGFEADGSNRFDEVTIIVDRTMTIGGVAGDKLLFCDSSGKLQDVILVANCYSGGTQPTSGTYQIWYDTTNNIIKRDMGKKGTWVVEETSLPLARVTSDGSVLTSIDQVFNGFGYIGSTVFALPNVKGLIPDGRNADGSLRNIEFVTSKVLTYTNIKVRNNANIVTDGTGIAPKDVWLYDEETNLNFGGETFPTKSTSIAIWSANNTSPFAITSFTPKLPFHAVDRNDSSWVSAQAMPSNKNITLNFGATNTSYTAPANGWFTVSVWSTSTATSYIHLINTSNELAILLVPNQGAGYQQRCFIPAKKGDIIKLVYGNLDTSRSNIRFIYSEGEE